MKEEGCWGDHVTLLAASMAFRVNIIVMTSPSRTFTIIHDRYPDYPTDIFLHYENQHYDYMRMDRKQLDSLRKIGTLSARDVFETLLKVSEPLEYLTQIEQATDKPLSNMFFWLYDCDLVEEDVFWSWRARSSNFERAGKFLHWLETAEEE